MTEVVITNENVVNEMRQNFADDVTIVDNKKTLEYKKKWSVCQPTGMPYSLCIEPNDLSKYGIGLSLFFDFIKSAIIIFLLMSIITIPILISNYQGDGLKEDFQKQNTLLSKLSIANQPVLSVEIPSSGASATQILEVQERNDNSLQDFKDTMERKKLYVIIPDVIYSLIFIIFIILFSRKSKEISASAKSTYSTPSQYAIEVKGIPTVVTRASDLKAHFEKFARVAEAVLVRDYNGTLFDHVKSSQLINRINIEKKKLEIKKKSSSKHVTKLEKKLLSLQKKVAKNTEETFGSNLMHDSYPSLKGIVVFETLEEKKSVLLRYRRFKGGCCSSIPSEMLFYGHKLTLNSRVDEPSNIRWENLDASGSDRCCRSFVVLILVIAIMIITFLIVFVANIVKPTDSEDCPQNDLQLTDVTSDPDNQTVKDCFCKQQSLSTIKNDGQIYNLCFSTYLRTIWNYVLNVATAIVIVFVNYFLKLILKALSKFSRYYTVTSEISGTTIKLFFAMFVNTALITLVLHGDIFGFKPALYISEPIPPLKSLQEKRSNEFAADFSRSWYVDVGQKITLTMLINIISPHLIFLLTLPYYRCKRRSNLNKAIIQRDANTNVLGPPFDLTSYYANTLNTIFVNLFYSGGMPYLIICGAFSLVVQYYCYKYILLRYSKRPPAYDHKLNAQIVKILPFSIIFHLMISIYMYGNPLIFPTSSTKTRVQENVSNSVNEVEIYSSESKPITTRSYQNVYLLITLLIIVGIYILRFTLFNFLMSFYKCLCCKEKSLKIHNTIKFGSYKSEYKAMSTRMIASYEIRMNEDYKQIVHAIDQTGKLGSANAKLPKEKQALEIADA